MTRVLGDLQLTRQPKRQGSPLFDGESRSHSGLVVVGLDAVVIRLHDKAGQLVLAALKVESE